MNKQNFSMKKSWKHIQDYETFSLMLLQNIQNIMF